MPGGYFYPNSQIKKQVNLIAEGLTWKSRFESQVRKFNSLDSSSTLLLSWYNQATDRITQLQIDSTFRKREIEQEKRFSADKEGFYKNFLDTVVKPTYDKAYKGTFNKGLVIGGLSGAIVTFIVLSVIK